MVLLISALVWAGGCSDTGSRERSVQRVDQAQQDVPEWLRAPPQRRGWVYAVGSASSSQRHIALAAARRELVNQLSVSIRAERTQEDRGQERRTSDGALQGDFRQSVAQRVHTQAAIADLPDVAVIAEHRQDDVHYVLVGFDRAQWASQLRSELAAVDAQLANPPAFLEGAHPLVRHARAHQWAQPLWTQRDTFQRRLRIAQPQADIPPAPLPRDHLQAALKVEFANLRVYLDIPPPLAAQRPYFEDGFTEHGASLSTTDAHLVVRLRGQVLVEPVGELFRGDGNINITFATPTKVVLGSVVARARASAGTQPRAESRTHQRLAADARRQLDNEFLAIIAQWN